MYKDFKIIVIEGMDCCGKETLSKMLTRDLKKSGNIVTRMSFPDYEINDYIVKYITGKIKNTHLDAYTEEAVYETARLFVQNIANSFHSKLNKKIRSINNTDKDKYVVLDRYYHSGMIYQLKKLFDILDKSTARIDNMDEARDMATVKFSNSLTALRTMYDLPVPDYVFFIKSYPEVIMELISRRRTKESTINEDSNSIHELYDFLYKYSGINRLEHFCKSEGSRLIEINNFNEAYKYPYEDPNEDTLPDPSLVLRPLKYILNDMKTVLKITTD